MGGLRVWGLVCLFASSSFGAWPKEDAAVTRFAFGGCNFQRMPQLHWPTIEKMKPQFWIWNGDAIYADPFGVPLREKEFKGLKANAAYASFIQKVPVFGVWDDHDYGADGADASVTDKPERQRMYLDFVDEPANSARRTQDGIYAAWTLGAKGNRVKLVLLDVRYFREKPAKTAELLGKDQWSWFEKEVAAGDFEFLVVVSGTQIISQDDSADKWANYGQERTRFFDVLDQVAAPVFLISGDRHHGELSKIKTASGKVIFEGTASGLTHSTTATTSKNSYRVGKWLPKRNFSTMDLVWDVDKLKSATVKIFEVSGKEFSSHVVAP